MTSETLHDLRQKLARGDDRAAEHLFRAYEPYLRMVVRRQLSPALRRKFDSVDIVQSIWANCLLRLRDTAGGVPDVEHLRAFLVRAARNRLIDHVRHERRALALETHGTATVAPAAREAKPSEVAQANDLWEQILAISPRAHHELLSLKRAGHSLDDIAARTGLHKSSVRRILYDLARRLAAHRQAGSAGHATVP